MEEQVVARTGTLQVSPDRVDDAVSTVRDRIPSYREQSGYKGFTILADRSSGKVIGISFWESQQELEASDELGRQAREAAAQTGGSQAEPVRETWEVLLDDMV
jgi:heme-degrading monooxygenase HmoA